MLLLLPPPKTSKRQQKKTKNIAKRTTLTSQNNLVQGQLVLADSYILSARTLISRKNKNGNKEFAPIYELMGRALELYLKAHLLSWQIPIEVLAKDYSHNYEKLGIESKRLGLPLHSQFISLFEHLTKLYNLNRYFEHTTAASYPSLNSYFLVIIGVREMVYQSFYFYNLPIYDFSRSKLRFSVVRKYVKKRQIKNKGLWLH